MTRAHSSVMAALLCAAFLLAALPLAGCNNKSREQIQALWTTWDKATGAADGKGAAAVISTTAVAYWEAIRRNALDGRSDDIMKMAPSDQAIIFKVRLAAKRSDLKGLDGRGFYSWYIANVADLAPAGTVKLRDLRIDKNAATAEIRGAEENPFSALLDPGSGHTGWSAEDAPKVMVRFERENGVWMIDDTSLLEANDQNLKRVAAKRRMTIRELLEQGYYQERGEVPPAEIWNPMKK